MDKQLFQNYPESKRKKMLADNAERREEFTYQRELSADEITQLKDELSKEIIALEKLEEEKKQEMDSFKESIDPVKKEIKRVTSLLRVRREEVEEDVYLLADQEEGMMGYYNAKGELVYTRPLYANEKQMRITHKSS